MKLNTALVLLMVAALSTSEPLFADDRNPQIMRHNKIVSKQEVIEGDIETIREVDKHIQRTLGKVRMVFHEKVSPDLHIDVYCVRTRLNGRNMNVLVTCGMSEKPMNVPKELNELKYAELAIILPGDWKLSEEGFKDENNYWPVRQLKAVARVPIEFDTWIGYGHTVPNGDPPKPFSKNVGFSTMIVLPSITLPKTFMTMMTAKKVVHFYVLVPLYQEETDYKLRNGASALLQKFNKYGIADIVDIERRNSCK